MTVTPATLIVLAKAPVAGSVKTRLMPDCTAQQAADLAAAALQDTLQAVASVADVRRVLVLEGERGPWCVPGFEVITQRGGGLDERLADAFEDVGGPAVLVGMDTPQLTADLLRGGLAGLRYHSSVLGLAADGGFWAVGLREADRHAFLGVPMSTDTTGVRQRVRLLERGNSVADLPILRDVDTWSDALAVAASVPKSRFARRCRMIQAGRSRT